MTRTHLAVLAALAAVWALSGTPASAQPTVSLTVNPSMVSLAQGAQSTQITVTVQISPPSPVDISGVLNVTIPPAATGVSAQPAQIPYTVTAGQTSTSASLTLSASPGTPAGSYTVRISDSTIPSFFVDLVLNVLAAAPSIEAVVPGTVTAGTRSVVLQVIGKNFPAGVSFDFNSPFVRVETTRVISPTLIELRITIRADAPAQKLDVDLSGPGGLLATARGVLTLLSEDSPGAALGVTSLTVVHPRPGTQIREGETLHARGLMAVTGSGTVTGRWLHDGVAFDHFTMNVQSGLPQPVVSHAPIPFSHRGRHTLQLVLDRPQALASPEVAVVQTGAEALALRLLRPPDGYVWVSAPPAFEWLPVPGVAAYEIEIERSEGRPVIFRATEARWVPSLRDLREIGAGPRRWRVIPVLPGGVRQPPSGWRRLAVLPGAVEIEVAPPRRAPGSRRLEVQWTGGSRGMAYLLEVLGEDRSTVHYSALTSRQAHLLPRGALSPGRYLFRVTALGPREARLGTGSIQATVGDPPEATGPPSSGDRPPEEGPSPGEDERPADEEPPAGADKAPPESPGTGSRRIESLVPADGSEVTARMPRIRATWREPVSPEEVVLRMGSTDVTGASRVRSRSVTFVPLEPLEPGEHEMELSLEGERTLWSFRVVRRGVPAAEAPPEAAEPPGAPPPARAEWTVNTEGGITAFDGEAASGREVQADRAQAALSGQLDYENGPFSAKSTADAAWTREIENEHELSQDNENWVVHLGLKGDRTAAGLKAGYALPGFLDQAQFLSAGVTRGGVEASVARQSWIRGTVYQSFEPGLGSVTSGDTATRQDFRAAALETGGGDSRYTVRLIGVDVSEEGDLQTGGDGSSYGLLGSFALSPGKSIVFEGARGQFDPAPGSFEEERTGSAGRLGFLASGSTYSYSVSLRHIGAGFVNPANRGFTAGGRGGRKEAQAVASKRIGRHSLNVGVIHQRGEGGDGPSSRSTSASAGYSGPLGRTVSLSATANLTEQASDADKDLSIESARRTDQGVGLSVTESVGPIQLVQSLSTQWHLDRNRSVEDTITHNASLSAGGPVMRNLLVSVTANGTRTVQDESLGDNTTLVASLQPVYAIPAAQVTIQPYLSYSKSRNPVQEIDLVSEQYRLRVAWTPRWLGSMATLDVSSDWTRSRDARAASDEGFIVRYTANLIISWSRSGSGSLAPMARQLRKTGPAPARMAPAPGRTDGASLR